MATRQTGECPVGELLTAYVDGEATDAEVQRIQEHLLCCPECASQLAFLRTLNVGLRAAPLGEASPALFDRIASATYAASPSPGRVFVNGIRDRVASLLAPPAVRIGFGTALAAAVVVAFVVPRASQWTTAERVAVGPVPASQSSGAPFSAAPPRVAISRQNTLPTLPARPRSSFPVSPALTEPRLAGSTLSGTTHIPAGRASGIAEKAVAAAKSVMPLGHVSNKAMVASSVSGRTMKATRDSVTGKTSGIPTGGAGAERSVVANVTTRPVTSSSVLSHSRPTPTLTAKPVGSAPIVASAMLVSTVHAPAVPSTRPTTIEPKMPEPRDTERVAAVPHPEVAPESTAVNSEPIRVASFGGGFRLKHTQGPAGSTLNSVASAAQKVERPVTTATLAIVGIPVN